MSTGRQLDVDDSAFLRMTRVVSRGEPVPEWPVSKWLPKDVYRPFSIEFSRAAVDLVAGPARNYFGSDGTNDAIWDDILRNCSALMISIRAPEVAPRDELVLRIDQELAIRIRKALTSPIHSRCITLLFNACDQVATDPNQAAAWCAEVLESCVKTTRAVCAGRRVRFYGFPVTTWGFGRRPRGGERFPVDAKPHNVLESLRATLDTLQGTHDTDPEQPSPSRTERLYDVALSFAGEDRAYVEVVADVLTRSGIAVFYDRYEAAQLWGEDLNDRLANVYGHKAKFVVLFISRFYAAKVWTNHELQFAQARSVAERISSILPVRFDDTEIPGLPSTVGYIDGRHVRPDEIAKTIMEKLAS